MQLDQDQFSKLAESLKQERKRQGLSREQLAAVCMLSTSFIRDAEVDPGNCTAGRLIKLLGGLGLRFNVNGWHGEFDVFDREPSPDPFPSDPDLDEQP